MRTRDPRDVESFSDPCRVSNLVLRFLAGFHDRCVYQFRHLAMEWREQDSNLQMRVRSIWWRWSQKLSTARGGREEKSSAIE
jgi:hypothetical protein